MPYTPTDSTRQSLDQAEQLNQLLLALPEATWQRLVPRMRKVNLTLGQILYEPGELIHTIYFPNQAMVSLVKIMADGSTIEAGLVGNEGIVGYPVYLGGKDDTSRAVVQISGNAIALDAATLKAEFDRHEQLATLLLRYTQAFLAQVSQTAACNRFHPTEERLARWLLQSQDAARAADLDLTQDFLSSMLGTRRASITLAAGRLQQAGLIQYNRGHITILDREALEAAACECYAVTKSAFKRLLDV